MKAEAFTYRRLTPRDEAQLCRLYQAQGADGCWAQPLQIALALRAGMGCGCESNGLLTAAWLSVAPCVAVNCVRALAKQQPLYGVPRIVLPPVCRAAEQGAFVRALAAAAPRRSLLLLGVKTGGRLAPALLQNGFVLVRMRALVRLRAHYIFCKNLVQTADKSRIIVAEDNTLALSRLLAHGGVCTDMQSGKATVYIRKEDIPHENSDFGQLCF